jgi:hypothetical protein
MNCKTCDYPLWNLPTHLCPECGTAFAASEYEFRPNSVRFCCPHCDQQYFGNTYNGHLNPVEFDCVTCGAHVHMDAMIVRPRDDQPMSATTTIGVPWEKPGHRSWFKAWMITIGWSMGAPGKLMQRLPVETSLQRAWWFAVLNSVTSNLLGITLPLLAFGLIIAMSGGGGGGPALMGFFIPAGVMLMGSVLSVFIMIPLWAAAAHVMLKITGGCAFGYRHTLHALLYSSGPTILQSVPCIGPYLLSYVGGIWWVVSACMMVTEGQKVHGGRATLAVLAMPLLLIIAVIALWMVLIFGIATAASTMPATVAVPNQAARQTQVMMVGTAVLDYAAAHQGEAPTHGLELVTAELLQPSDFVTGFSMTTLNDIPVGDRTLWDLVMMPRGERDEHIQYAAQQLPANVIAHRVGDVVFTYHGIDMVNPPSDLWIAVVCPDANLNTVWDPAGETYFVMTGSGITRSISGDTFRIELADQNALRQSAGLDPLPDVRDLTHDAPALGSRVN